MVSIDPKVDAPELGDDGRLHFASPQALVRIYDGFLSRGGLPVRPKSPLPALAQVTIKLGDDDIEIAAQVVMINADVTVLRVIDAIPPSVEKLVDAARDQTPAPDIDQLSIDQESIDQLSIDQESIELDIDVDDTGSNDDNLPKWANNTLSFRNLDQALDHERDLLADRAVDAVTTSPASSGAAGISIVIGSHGIEMSISGSVHVDSPDRVRISFSDTGALAGAFRALVIGARANTATQTKEGQSQSQDKAKKAPTVSGPQLVDVNDALAAFLQDAAAPIPSSREKPQAATFDLELPATTEPPRDLFDVPPTGSEDELTAIVDAFDASPTGLNDVLDIDAPDLTMPAPALVVATGVESIEKEAPADLFADEKKPAPAQVFDLPPPVFIDEEHEAAENGDDNPIVQPNVSIPAFASFEENTLIFRDGALGHVREDFETLGLIWARVDDDLVIDCHHELSIRVSIDDTVVDAALPAVGMRGPPGIAILRVLDTSALAAILGAVTPTDDSTASSTTTEKTSARAVLSGTSLAFSGIDELRMALADIERTGRLEIKCLTSPPALLNVDANVAGASIGSGWTAAFDRTSNASVLNFGRPSDVVEAITLFLNAFGDSAQNANEVSTPSLSGHFIHFAHANLATIAANEIEEHKAILVSPVVPLSVEESREIRFQVAEAPLDAEFRVRLHPAQEGKAIAFFSHEDAAPAAALLRSALVAPAQTLGISTQKLAEAAFENNGRVRNPSSAAQLLEIPIVRVPTHVDVATPSIPLLLRLVMAGQGLHRIRLQPTTESQALEFYVDNGRRIHASLPIAKLATKLSFQDGRYGIERVDVIDPEAKTQMLTVSLIGELTRALVRRISIDALERGFPHALDGPTMNERGQRLLESVGFSTTQTRTARKTFGGTESALYIVNGMRSPLVGWEMLYTLEIMGGLSWSTLSADAQSNRGDTLDVEWQQLQALDDFDVLGLHWSTAPRHIGPAFTQAIQRYGPQSPTATAHPRTAAKIVARITEAHERLDDPKRRRDYRKELFSLQWSQQSDLMLSNAKLATYRGDLHEARDLLEGILDFSTNVEASALLKKLQAAGLA